MKLLSLLFVLANILCAAEAVPVVALSANSSGAPVVPQGWPLILQASIIAAGEPLSVNLDGAVHVMLTAPNGVVAQWPLRIVPPAQPVAELDRFDMTQIFWTLTPEQTAALEPGDWKVRVTVGSIESREIKIRVVPHPAEELPLHQLARLMHLSHLSQLHGDLDQALAHAQSAIDAQPQSVTALLRKGDVLLLQGQPAEALSIFTKAEVLFVEQDQIATHPPVIIQRRKAAAQRALLQLE